MRRMTFDAAHPALGHRMVTWQIEFSANVGVALIANRIVGTRPLHGHPRPRADRLWSPGAEAERWFRFSARLRMQTARSVTRFAPSTQRIWTFRDQSRTDLRSGKPPPPGPERRKQESGLLLVSEAALLIYKNCALSSKTVAFAA